MEALYQMAMLALATTTISLTLTKSFFGDKIREWMEARSEWFGELFSCWYCLSHWVALGFALVYFPRPLQGFIVVDFAVSWFGIVAMSALVSGTIVLFIQTNNYLAAKE